MTDLVPRKRKRWRPPPWMSRREQAASLVLVVLAVVTWALGWLAPWAFVVFLAAEAAALLIIPSRTNRWAVKEAADLGVIKAAEAESSEPK